VRCDHPVKSAVQVDQSSSHGGRAGGPLLSMMRPALRHANMVRLSISSCPQPSHLTSPRVVSCRVTRIPFQLVDLERTWSRVGLGLARSRARHATGRAPSDVHMPPRTAPVDTAHDASTLYDPTPSHCLPSRSHVWSHTNELTLFSCLSDQSQKSSLRLGVDRQENRYVQYEKKSIKHSIHITN